MGPSTLDNRNKPTFLDVFSGCGGLSLGMFAAGWQGVFAIEKSADAFATLKHTLVSPNAPCYRFDWTGWLSKEAMEVYSLLEKHGNELLNLQGKIDLIAGGPPCQGFSSAGKRDPNDPRNSLTGEYLRVVNLVQPRFLLIENVRGFNIAFKSQKKPSNVSLPYSQMVKKKLESMGYSVFTGMVCCSDFGVPQYRKRFIMIAIKENDPALEAIGNKNPIDSLVANAPGFRSGKGLTASVETSAKDAISDLETKKHDLISHTGPIKGFKQVKYTEPESLSEYQELMRAGMEGSPPNSLRLVRHTEPVTERFKDIHSFAAKGKCLTPADRELLGMKKHSTTPLHPYLPSVTVTTLPDDILHYSEPRILTVRENARLQSFPDWFEFQGKYTTGGKRRKIECPRYTQVGNAVPPLLSEAIGLLLYKLAQANNREIQQEREWEGHTSQELPEHALHGNV